MHHRATSVRAWSSGLITQHATSACRTSAVPSTRIRFMTRVPAREMGRIMRDVLGAGIKLAKIFCEKVLRVISPLRERSDFNSLAERFSEAKLSEIASEGQCVPAFQSPSLGFSTT